MPDSSSQDFQGPPQNILTPDFARSSPEQYKQLLLDTFQTQTINGARAYRFITTERGVSTDKITIDPDTWHSGHNMKAGTIRLGLGPMSAQEKMFNFPFETNSFTDEQTTKHILAHEVAHFIGEAIADQIEAGTDIPALKQYDAFMRSFTRFRENGQGVTTHAGTQHYKDKGADIQAVEDMTDLFALYIVDPAYLQRYLRFLADPQYKEKRTELNLVTLPPELPDLMYKNIDRVFNQVVK
jgi:hypothetical protein